jgi:hypothetical protein
MSDLATTTAEAPVRVPAPPDPLALLSELTIDDLLGRLDALETERKTVKGLLRVVRARERAALRTREVIHA